MAKRKSRARGKARAISKGKKEPQHIGHLSGAALQQEFFSLSNTKPAFRKDKFFKRLAWLSLQISKEDYNSFVKKYNL